jgi:hypothetical protein
MEIDPNLHYACIYQLLPLVIIKTLLSLPKTSLRRLHSSKGVNHLAIRHDIAKKWSSNDSAKMVSLTPVATDHSHQSRLSDSERADQQYHICLQPLDEPVWRYVR